MNKLEKVTIQLPKDWVERLRELEETTSHDINYYIKESIFRYLEDLEDYELVVKALKNTDGATYSGLNVDKRLDELKQDENK